MTTSRENNPPTLESIAEGQRALTESLSELDKFVRTVAGGTLEALRNLRTDVDGLTTRVDGLTAKVDGLTTDIAEVKGGHARSSVLRNAALVVDSMDCRLISEVPRGVILGFARIAADSGEPKNDVESFRNADMVMYVSDAQDHPRYIAIEASFTVDDRDVRRAVRNAGYLQKYTGLPADAVVAGVDVLQDAQTRIDQGEVRLYQIQRRELQPE